jgi:hypothetical protein
MNKSIFYNENGNTYYILFGEKGKKSFLCKINDNYAAKYVICAVLEENSWCLGEYFDDFNEAYNCWKGQDKNE